MNVIDSSGWLEYLTDGKNADFFAAPIGDAPNLVTPTICLYEVFKRVLVTLGEEKALNVMGTIAFGQTVDLSRDLAIEAARISAELKLAMADSIILATARAYDAALWTQDAHFKGVAGVQYIEKPA
jgi:predicted nucleic acid-binding protein